VVWFVGVDTVVLAGFEGIILGELKISKEAV
jgi:hypothetical protein